ncbi:MAG: hypothetical protein JNK63_05070 [Chthonomonas sp.]|nr:hypothetical protein [Chthonomonas sp.]
MSDEVVAPPAPPTPKKSGLPAWVWAIVAVALCFPCIAILAAILFPVFAQARLAAKRTNSLSNIKDIGTASIMYAADNDDRFQPAERWQDSISEQVSKTSFTDPMVEAKSDLGYGMNTAASTAKVEWIDDPNQTVLFFTSSMPGRSASGGPETLRYTQRYAIICFVDGSARVLKDDSSIHPNWTIKQPSE